QLDRTVKSLSSQYRLYEQQDAATSVGQRLTYWKNSLRFFARAPLIGHGTGSIKELFEQAANGPNWLAGTSIVPNPHNQTLNVAVQWGAIGIIVLYATWLTHLLLFRGPGLINWLGLLVVTQ